MMLLRFFLLVAVASSNTQKPQPGPEATLDEVWAWMSSIAKNTEVNVNMYMSGNKMSMANTVFTMDV